MTLRSAFSITCGKFAKYSKQMTLNCFTFNILPMFCKIFKLNDFKSHDLNILHLSYCKQRCCFFCFLFVRSLARSQAPPRLNFATSLFAISSLSMVNRMYNAALVIMRLSAKKRPFRLAPASLTRNSYPAIRRATHCAGMQHARSGIYGRREN